MHDRSHCTVLAFNDSCSCDVGHTGHSDNAIASCILTATRTIFETEYESTPSKKRSGRFRVCSIEEALRLGLAGGVDERPGYARTKLSRFRNERHAPQSRRSLPVMPDRRTLGIWEYDRADAHGSSGTLDRDGENEFAMGRRPLSPWAPYPSPSRPAGHPRVHRADARGWLSLAQP